MTASLHRHAAVALVALLAAGCGGGDATDLASNVDPSVAATASDLASAARSEVDTEAIDDAASDAAETASEAMTDIDTESVTDMVSDAIGDLADVELPEGFPTDVPVPEGFVGVVADSQLDDAGPSSYTLDGEVEGDEAPEVIVDKLVAAWETQGWEVVDRATDPGAAALADVDLERDGDTANLRFTREDGALRLSVTMDLLPG